MGSGDKDKSGSRGSARAGRTAQAGQEPLATPPPRDGAEDVAAPKSAAATVCLATARLDLGPALAARLALEPDLRFRRICRDDLPAVLDFLAQWGPWLALLDSALLRNDPAEALGEIRLRLPHARLVLLWEDPADLPLDDILVHDVAGCLWLHSEPDLYQKAIRALLAGEQWLPHWLVARMMAAIRTQLGGGNAVPAAATEYSRLTPREAEIARLAREGFSNKEIARSTGICEDTVKKHLKSIFAKLGIRRRSQLPACGAGRR
jgi:DNA-binding NarL/FixJ family response regulator